MEANNVWDGIGEEMRRVSSYSVGYGRVPDHVVPSFGLLDIRPLFQAHIFMAMPVSYPCRLCLESGGV